jgi:cell division control protein 12
MDDDENAEPARNLIEAMPFSIIGSTEDVRTPDGRVVKGREYIWGVAEGLHMFSSHACTLRMSFFSGE